MALVKDLTEGSIRNSWAEASGTACDIGNICVTTTNEGGTSPFEKWQCMPPALDGIQPFGMVGYQRATIRKHKPSRVALGASWWGRLTST